eukprot:1198219-Rhodomonas_salina.1
MIPDLPGYDPYWFRHKHFVPCLLPRTLLFGPCYPGHSNAAFKVVTGIPRTSATSRLAQICQIRRHHRDCGAIFGTVYENNCHCLEATSESLPGYQAGPSGVSTRIRLCPARFSRLQIFVGLQGVANQSPTRNRRRSLRHSGLFDGTRSRGGRQRPFKSFKWAALLEGGRKILYAERERIPDLVDPFRVDTHHTDTRKPSKHHRPSSSFPPPSSPPSSWRTSSECSASLPPPQLSDCAGTSLLPSSQTVQARDRNGLEPYLCGPQSVALSPMNHRPQTLSPNPKSSDSQSYTLSPGPSVMLPQHLAAASSP